MDEVGWGGRGWDLCLSAPPPFCVVMSLPIICLYLFWALVHSSSYSLCTIYDKWMNIGISIDFWVSWGLMPQMKRERPMGLGCCIVKQWIVALKSLRFYHKKDKGSWSGIRGVRDKPSTIGVLHIYWINTIHFSQELQSCLTVLSAERHPLPPPHLRMMRSQIWNRPLILNCIRIGTEKSKYQWSRY